MIKLFGHAVHDDYLVRVNGTWTNPEASVPDFFGGIILTRHTITRVHLTVISATFVDADTLPTRSKYSVTATLQYPTTYVTKQI